MSVDDGMTEQWLKRVYGGERASEHLRTTLPSAVRQRARDGRGRRTLNLLAGIAGVAAVSAGVGWTALQLAHHRGGEPPASGAATLTSIPHYGPGGLPSPVQVLVPLTRASGSATLLPFTPAEPYYVQFACSGGGAFAFRSLDNAVSDTVQHCDGATTTVREPSESATASSVPLVIAPTILRVTAQPATRWEMVVVQEGSDVLPPLGGSGLPVPAQVLVPLTQGSGTVTLPAFTPTRPYYIDYVCIGTFGPFDIDSSDGAVHYATEGCGSAVGGAIVDPPAGEVLGKPVTLRVDAPQKRWEILVVQIEPPAAVIPVGFSLPAGATVLVPLTYGTGAKVLPAFTATRDWFIEITCSGEGSLAVVSASGSTLSQVSCGGPSRYGAIHGSAQTVQIVGQRQTLSVQADPASDWIILVYENEA